MEGYTKKPRYTLSIKKFAGCKTEVKGRIDVRRRLLLLIALRNKVKEGHSTPLKPHSGLGTNYVKLESICPQNGSAVLVEIFTED